MWVFPNQRTPIDSQLATSWYYKKLKFLRGHEVVGPVSGETFLQLYSAKTFFTDTEVSSPEFTGGQWIELERLNLDDLHARIKQRRAESERVAKAEERRRVVKEANLAKLSRAVQAAVSDGTVSLREREQLLGFASRAGIPVNDVEQVLQDEAQNIVRSLIDESLEDGVLDPQERQKIGEIASSLGVEIQLTEDQNRRLHLCNLAYELATGTYLPDCRVDGSVSLAANETPLSKASFEWHEIVQLKRAAGIPLGDDHYLKSICGGLCVLTNKRVLLVSHLAAKKFALSSVAQVKRFADGVLFTRSSGKSVFLRTTSSANDCDTWALVAESLIARDPVLGALPTGRFIQEVPSQQRPATSSWSDSIRSDEPRYTFRVVGDHIGNRADYIARLAVGAAVFLCREPTNAYDANAVAVFDKQGNQLGYLKRDVAEWFARILDSGRNFNVIAYRKPRDGGLIVGVYER